MAKQNKEAEKEAPKAPAVPKKSSSKKMYWKSPTHIIGHGSVSGLVTAETKAAFEANTPKETDIKNWTQDSDPIAEAKKLNLADAKRRLGLN